MFKYCRNFNNLFGKQIVQSHIPNITCINVTQFYSKQQGGTQKDKQINYYPPSLSSRKKLSFFTQKLFTHTRNKDTTAALATFFSAINSRIPLDSVIYKGILSHLFEVKRYKNLIAILQLLESERFTQSEVLLDCIAKNAFFLDGEEFTEFGIDNLTLAADCLFRMMKQNQKYSATLGRLFNQPSDLNMIKLKKILEMKDFKPFAEGFIETFFDNGMFKEANTVATALNSDFLEICFCALKLSNDVKKGTEYFIACPELIEPLNIQKLLQRITNIYNPDICLKFIQNIPSIVEKFSDSFVVQSSILNVYGKTGNYENMMALHETIVQKFPENYTRGYYSVLFKRLAEMNKVETLDKIFLQIVDQNFSLAEPTEIYLKHALKLQDTERALKILKFLLSLPNCYTAESFHYILQHFAGDVKRLDALNQLVGERALPKLNKSSELLVDAFFKDKQYEFVILEYESREGHQKQHLCWNLDVLENILVSFCELGQYDDAASVICDLFSAKSFLKAKKQHLDVQRIPEMIVKLLEYSIGAEDEERSTELFCKLTELGAELSSNMKQNILSVCPPNMNSFVTECIEQAELKGDFGKGTQNISEYQQWEDFNNKKKLFKKQKKNIL